jgi:hypothetical protein
MQLFRVVKNSADNIRSISLAENSQVPRRNIVKSAALLLESFGLIELSISANNFGRK